MVIGDSLAQRPVIETVDHLLLGAADLESGIEWVENLTGVRALPGGSHPGVGTRNALLSLGGWRYLEVIAPDPAQPAFNFRIDLRALAIPRLVSWAAATKNLESIRKRGSEAGYRIAGPEEGAREKPDGKLLRWTIVSVATPFDRPETEVFPFFIRWAEDSTHPSQDSPRGCELVSFRMIHPDASAVEAGLKRLGIESPVGRGPEVRLSATLQTPKGMVEVQ